MKISTKGRYGLRAMVDLALNSGAGHIPLNVIAERQNVSANYMEVGPNGLSVGKTLILLMQN